jgi:hypothetical protein
MKPADPRNPGGDDSAKEPARKPYQKPELQVYGDLAEITRANAGSNKPDGNGHPNKHFTS